MLVAIEPLMLIRRPFCDSFRETSNCSLKSVLFDFKRLLLKLSFATLPSSESIRVDCSDDWVDVDQFRAIEGVTIIVVSVSGLYSILPSNEKLLLYSRDEESEFR